MAPASQEPLSWDFAAEIGLVSAFGTLQVIPGAWVDAAPRSPPVSRVQKVRRAGNSEVHIRTPPPFAFLLWGTCKACPAIPEELAQHSVCHTVVGKGSGLGCTSSLQHH